MTDSEGPSVPPLPGRARHLRWRYHLVRTLLVLAMLGLAAGLPGSGSVRDKYRYALGDIARERVVAPYDFRVQKDENQLRREQQQAATAVPPVFFVDARVSSEALARYASFEERVLATVLDGTMDPADRAQRLRGLGVPLSDESAGALRSRPRATRAARAGRGAERGLRRRNRDGEAQRAAVRLRGGDAARRRDRAGPRREPALRPA